MRLPAVLSRFPACVLFGLMCGLTCGLLPAPAEAQSYTSIVVIGDSLSDTGNDANLSAAKYTLAGQVPGIASNYATGRFTDGPLTTPAARTYSGVWVEQLAAMLAAHPAVTDSLDGGSNYACGFAFTGTGTTVLAYGPGNALFVNVENLGQQVNDFLATNPKITPATLFVVWGGANDLLNATSTSQITAAAAGEITVLTRLIAAGATEFIVPNLPPLGLIPRLNGSSATSVPATQATQVFNGTLAAGLAALPSVNAAGTAIHIRALDVYDLFNQVVGPPLGGGFTNVTASSQATNVNPDQYLFWDSLHPTTVGHHLIALAAATLLAPTATTTTTTLTPSSPNTILNNPVTLTATVAAGSGSTPPLGPVTFLDGANVLGTAYVTVAGATTGSATLTTSALSAGTHVLTASFTGVNGYANSTSTPVSEVVTAPGVQASFSPAAVTVMSGSTATTSLTLTPLGSYAGSASFACGTLPAHLSCSFSPASVTFSAGATAAQTSTLTIGTTASAALRLPAFGVTSGPGIVLAALPCAGLLLIFRRRSLPIGLRLASVWLGLFSGALLALAGCGSSNTPAPSTQTAAGTYTVPVTLTTGNGTSLLTLTVTVQ